MPRINKHIFLVLIFFAQQAFSQNYFNSPYTRYKIGDLTDNGFALNSALGGSSIALRPANQLNYLNPASYTSQDTTSFLLQLGFIGRYAKVQSSLDDDKTLNFNIDYIAIGFPAGKWWNMSVGLAPYSRIQYFVRQEVNDSVLGEDATFDYSGFGGFNEFFFGNAFEIGSLLSVGINTSYLFGSLDRTQISYLTDLQSYSAKIEHVSNYIANDFYFKMGAQLHPVIKEKHKLVLGATYDFQSNISVKIKGKTTRYNTAAGYDISTDTIKFNTDSIVPEPLVLPTKIGIGISYSYNDMFTITGEYIKQDWTGSDFGSFKTGLYESYRFGLEVLPMNKDNIRSESYFRRIHYQAGIYSTKTYLYYNGINISSKGFTAGLALPIKNSRKFYTGTTFNIGYQFGIRGTTDYGLIKETKHFITFGLTLHDFWFMKPKYD